MSKETAGNTTRRGFLGTATAAAALAIAARPGADAQAASLRVGGIQMAEATTTEQGAAPAAAASADWTKPAAMALPKEGYFKLEQGRYGPTFPRTPANYGFTVIAKVKPGREQAIRD